MHETDHTILYTIKLLTHLAFQVFNGSFHGLLIFIGTLQIQQSCLTLFKLLTQSRCVCLTLFNYIIPLVVQLKQQQHQINGHVLPFLVYLEVAIFHRVIPCCVMAPFTFSTKWVKR